MTYLLDANILLALAWPTHFHHERAQTWFSKKGARGWATCPMTQCAFVRISSHPKVFKDAVSPQDALVMLSIMTSHKGHSFWSDSVDISACGIERFQLAGHRQISDGYLVLLAESRKGILATFDRAIASSYIALKGKAAPVEIIDG